MSAAWIGLAGVLLGSALTFLGTVVTSNMSGQREAERERKAALRKYLDEFLETLLKYASARLKRGPDEDQLHLEVLSALVRMDLYSGRKDAPAMDAASNVVKAVELLDGREAIYMVAMLAENLPLWLRGLFTASEIRLLINHEIPAWVLDQAEDEGREVGA